MVSPSITLVTVPTSTGVVSLDIAGRHSPRVASNAIKPSQPGAAFLARESLADDRCKVKLRIARQSIGPRA